MAELVNPISDDPREDVIHRVTTALEKTRKGVTVSTESIEILVDALVDYALERFRKETADHECAKVPPSEYDPRD